jgi:hypothetical protein
MRFAITTGSGADSGGRADGRGELSEDACPALRRTRYTARVEDRAHLGCSRAEAVEVAVLEVDPGLIRPDRLEANLDLGHQFRVEPEVRRDLPGQDEPLRRLPDEDLAPVGFSPIDPALDQRPPAKGSITAVS